MKKAAKQLPPVLAAQIETLKKARARSRQQFEKLKASIRNTVPETQEEREARETTAAKKAAEAYGDKPPYWNRDH